MRKKIFGIVLATALCGLTACANATNNTVTKEPVPATSDSSVDVVETSQKEEVTTEGKTTEETMPADVPTEESSVEIETTLAEETQLSEETATNEPAAEEPKTTASETTGLTTEAPTTKATEAATTKATEAATTKATEAGTLGKNPYTYRGGYELETDPKTGELVVDKNGYYTKLGLQKPLTVKKNDKGGTRIDVYGEEPGPYFIIDVASYQSKPSLVACTLGEGKRDDQAKLVDAWWGDGKKLNVVLWCQQCPVNCLYVLDLSSYTSQIKEKEEAEVTKREISIVFKYSEAEKYEFKVEAISKKLVSSTATKAKLKKLTEDDTYYYFDLTSKETGDFRAKYNKSTGKISLEF